MPEAVDINEDVAVATLVGKALRQRLHAPDIVPRVFEGVPMSTMRDEVDTDDPRPYWLQAVNVDDSYRSEPIITDHLGRRFKVTVERLDP